MCVNVHCVSYTADESKTDHDREQNDACSSGQCEDKHRLELNKTGHVHHSHCKHLAYLVQEKHENRYDCKYYEYTSRNE